MLVLPLAAAGTLVAHALAYWVTGAPSEGVHGYLVHLPQLLVILALPALLSAAISGRSSAPPAWPFAAACASAFVFQEHIERLAHTGELPFLLDRPVFLVGLALQAPFAVAVWAIARVLLRVAGGQRAERTGPPRVPDLSFLLTAPSSVGRSARGGRRASSRGPPAVVAV